LRESPLERGASSVVKMEEAGCVKIRIPDQNENQLPFTSFFGIIDSQRMNGFTGIIT
jgi:hypothetical protein